MINQLFLPISFAGININARTASAVTQTGPACSSTAGTNTPNHLVWVLCGAWRLAVASLATLEKICVRILLLSIGCP